MFLKITTKAEDLLLRDGRNANPLKVTFNIWERAFRLRSLYQAAYVREVTVPEGVEISFDRNLFQASEVILGPRRPLSEVDTWKWIAGNGVEFLDVQWLTCWAYDNGHEAVAKYLESLPLKF
jgi:hypothetical protein